MKSKRTKATDISMVVKKKVFKRDEGKCVICGNMVNVMPNSHYIRRSHGGLGIEENVFTACTNFTENNCHERWDRYKCTDDEIERVKNHFRSHYPNWDNMQLTYKKSDLY